MWQQWVNVILGLVVVAVPFLSLSTTAFTWTLALAGIIIAGLSLWHATEMTQGSSETYARR